MIEVRAKDLLVWRDSTSQHNARPAVNATTVFVLSSFQDVFNPGAGQVHQVTALDRANGSRRWRTSLPLSDQSQGGYGIQLVAGVVVVGDGDVFGLDPNDGHLLWHYVPTIGRWPGYFFQGTDGTRVFTGSTSSHVFALDVQTGAQLWVSSISDLKATVFNPVYANGRVFVAFNEDRPSAPRSVGGMAAVDAVTGQLLWSIVFGPPLGLTGYTVQSVAVAGNRVFAGVSSGPVYALDVSTGSLVDSIPATTFLPKGSSPQGALYVLKSAANRLFVGSSLGSVVALDGTSLSRLWYVGTLGSSVLDLSADNSAVYVGCIGQLVVLNVLDGKRLWSLQPYDLRTDGDDGGIWTATADGDRAFYGGSKEVYGFKKQ